MNLQKTSTMAGNTPSGKAVTKPPAQNAAASNVLPAQTAKPALLAGSRSISAMVYAAGLPADKLSASIISFARFFSLPLKPQLMAEIRRKAFTQPAVSPAATGSPAASAKPAGEKNLEPGILSKMRETFSLAAAAAESKNVELKPKGIEGFAEAIDPDREERQDSEQQHKHQNQNEQKEEDSSKKANPFTAAGVKDLALESAENNPLLAILNRLPTENGQRWIVLPFDFCENGRQFNVSMRILLETESTVNAAGHKLALDIAESGDTKRRWLFILDASGLLSVFLQPELPLKTHFSFISGLSELLNVSPERISVKNMTEPFPFEAGGEEELLRSIDEAV